MRVREWVKKVRPVALAIALLSIAAAGMANWPNH